jgi:hypothetical protein
MLKEFGRESELLLGRHIGRPNPLGLVIGVVDILHEGHEAVCMVLGECPVVVVGEVPAVCVGKLEPYAKEFRFSSLPQVFGKIITRKMRVVVESIKTRCPQSLLYNTSQSLYSDIDH